ncbi:MAG: DUF3604 domain-containing protein [Actinomycetota bacterium]
MKRFSRREFIRDVGAGAALLVAAPRLVMGAGGKGQEGALRASQLLPSTGQFVVHSDLHNHSLISGDAFGDPATAYAQMRARGIDVACVTEHAISGKGHGEITCPGHEEGGCHKIEGINGADWEYMAELADASYDPGEFVSFRGFEWSTPTVGHLNVWFSEEFTDALHEFAFFTPTAIAEVDQIAPVPSNIVDLAAKLPELATMRFFYQWLASPSSRALLGGGNDGIACFNHPNEYGSFEHFAYHPEAAPHVVSIEALNGDRDFFWFGLDHDPPKPNPFNACLNAGWRVGFTGVSDEHSTEYGREGMARGGLWLTEMTREGVRAALESRRSFATFEPGLRLDATANGAPMGAELVHGSGVVVVQLDFDAGPEWAGRPITIEVVRPGSEVPALAAVLANVPVPAPSEPPITFAVDVDLADGDWMFLRITDPSRPPHPLATEPYRSHGGALAYASPWFLRAPGA